MTILGALLVLFIGLKLTDNIDWSWWWVLAPGWVPLAVMVVLALISAILLTIDQAREKRGKNALWGK